MTAVYKECIPNVKNKIIKHSGSIVYGWQLWKHSFMIEAEFHSIWKSPKGMLIDITPKQFRTDYIIFIEDSKTPYNGKQIANIMINTTRNDLVDDFIELNQARFRIENKDERATINDEITLSGQEAELYNLINTLISHTKRMILLGSTKESECFCGKGSKYKDCHGQNLMEDLKKYIKL